MVDVFTVLITAPAEVQAHTLKMDIAFIEATGERERRGRLWASEGIIGFIQ